MSKSITSFHVFVCDWCNEGEERSTDEYPSKWQKVVLIRGEFIENIEIDLCDKCFGRVKGLRDLIKEETKKKLIKEETKKKDREFYDDR